MVVSMLHFYCLPVFFFAGNGTLLQEKIEDDAASTAFCCIGNGDKATQRQAGEDKEELAKNKKE